MISPFLGWELRAWLLRDMVAELGLASLEFASLIGPLGDAVTRGILDGHQRGYQELVGSTNRHPAEGIQMFELANQIRSTTDSPRRGKGHTKYISLAIEGDSYTYVRLR